MYRQVISNYGKLFLVTVFIVLFIMYINQSTTIVVEVQFPQFTQNQSRNSVDRATPTKAATTALPVVREFNVFNSKCKIPRVDPFSADAMSRFKAPKFKNCTDQPDIVTVSYDIKKRQYVMHINETLPLLLYPDISSFGCVYYQIARGHNDSVTRLFTPNYFEENFLIPRYFLGILVECYEVQNISRILQRDAFVFVQYPKGRNDENDAERSRKHPSIIMLGIDSMSQINFQRTMPLTAQFVRQSGWYEMLGYNKIGDNTLPNIFALLTGGTANQWRHFCNVTKPGCLDAMTFIWNNFQNAGYLTAFAEDVPLIDTFHYHLPGFLREPVDFYLRPFMTGITPHLNKVIRFGYNYCLGRRQSYQYIFDYCRQLVQRFIQETPKPLFGLFWANSFSHDDFSGPASVDADIVDYLEQYKKLGLFEKAIVIFFSDHGQRQGPLMELPSSFLEERLPMMHIYLPPWYRQQHPKIANALSINSRRLSTPYDLFKTLRSVLELSFPRLAFPALPYCVGCRSLFTILPEHRSCQDAFISEHWCTCEPYIQVKIDQSLNFLAKLIIYRINQLLTKNKLDKLCCRLRLGELLKVERKLKIDDKGNEMTLPSETETYRLKFITQPNRGLFRATVQTNMKTQFVDIKEEFITRLNTYRNDSFCVSNRKAKKYCVCFKAQREYKEDDEIYEIV